MDLGVWHPNPGQALEPLLCGQEARPDAREDFLDFEVWHLDHKFSTNLVPGAMDDPHVLAWNSPNRSRTHAGWRKVRSRSIEARRNTFRTPPPQALASRQK